MNNIDLQCAAKEHLLTSASIKEITPSTPSLASRSCPATLTEARAVGLIKSIRGALTWMISMARVEMLTQQATFLFGINHATDADIQPVSGDSTILREFGIVRNLAMISRFVKDARAYSFVVRKLNSWESDGKLTEYQGLKSRSPALRFDFREIGESSTIAHSTWFLLLLSEIIGAEDDLHKLMRSDDKYPETQVESTGNRLRLVSGIANGLLEQQNVDGSFRMSFDESALRSSACSESELFSAQCALSLLHAFSLCNDERYLLAAERHLQWSQDLFDKGKIPSRDDFAYFANFTTQVCRRIAEISPRDDVRRNATMYQTVLHHQILSSNFFSNLPFNCATVLTTEVAALVEALSEYSSLNYAPPVTPSQIPDPASPRATPLRAVLCRYSPRLDRTTPALSLKSAPSDCPTHLRQSRRVSDAFSELRSDVGARRRHSLPVASLHWSSEHAPTIASSEMSEIKDRGSSSRESFSTECPPQSRFTNYSPAPIHRQLPQVKSSVLSSSFPSATAASSSTQEVARANSHLNIFSRVNPTTPPASTAGPPIPNLKLQNSPQRLIPCWRKPSDEAETRAKTLTYIEIGLDFLQRAQVQSGRGAGGFVNSIETCTERTDLTGFAAVSMVKFLEFCTVIPPTELKPAEA